MRQPRMSSPDRVLLLSSTLAIVATFGFGVLAYAFGVVLLPMVDELGWTSATVSAGLSLALVVSGLAAPWIGRVIDLHGARQVMIAGSLLGGAGMALWAMSTSLAVYLTAWTIIGAAMAMVLYEPAFAAVARHIPGHQRSAVLTITLLGGLASTIFVPLTGFLVAAFDWRRALFVLAAGFVTVTLPLIVVAVPARGRRLVSVPSPDVGHHVASRGATDQSSPTLRTSPTLRRLAFAMVVSRTAAVAVIAHLVAFLVASGHATTAASVLAGAVGVAKVAGRLAVGLAAKRVPVRTLTSAALVASAGGLLIPLVAPSGSLDIMMVVLFGAGAGAVTVLQPLYVVELFGTKSFGVTSGRVGRIARLSEAATPVAVGTVVTLTGTYTPVWLLLAAAAVTAALALPRRVH